MVVLLNVMEQFELTTHFTIDRDKVVVQLAIAPSLLALILALLSVYPILWVWLVHGFLMYDLPKMMLDGLQEAVDYAVEVEKAKIDEIVQRYKIDMAKFRNDLRLRWGFEGSATAAEEEKRVDGSS